MCVTAIEHEKRRKDGRRMGLRDADILCTYSSQENSIETMQ